MIEVVGKYGKEAYEQGMIEEKRSNIQQYEPRSDGVTNCLTTFTKDNLYIAKVRHKDERTKNT